MNKNSFKMEDFRNQRFLRTNTFAPKVFKIIKEINNLSQKEFIELKISNSNEFKDSRNDTFNPLNEFLEIMNDIKTNLIKMDYESRINLLIELLQFQMDLNLDKIQSSESSILKIDSLESSILKNQYIINEIVSCWSNDDSENSSVEAIEGVIGDLAGTYNCSKKLLKFLVQSLCSLSSNLNPTMILETHIRTRGDEGFVFSYVAERILEAYEIDNLPDGDWNLLHDITETVEANDVMEYIKSKFGSKFGSNFGSKLDLSSKTLKKPKWILNSRDVKSQILDQQNSQDILKYLSLNLDLESEINKYINPEEIKPQGQSSLFSESEVAPLTRDEVIKNFKALGFCHMNSPSEAKNLDELIRRYGPINEIEDIECSSHPLNLDSPDPRFPCQMLYCMCRETDELGTEEFLSEAFEEFLSDGNAVSWFNGMCIECHCKIKKPEHAVRFPVEDGGWIGCFCGFECMKKSEIRPMYKSDIHRINEVHKILDEIGIYEK